MCFLAPANAVKNATADTTTNTYDATDITDSSATINGVKVMYFRLNEVLG
jgi:hypothetical protein